MASIGNAGGEPHSPTTTKSKKQKKKKGGGTSNPNSDILPTNGDPDAQEQSPLPDAENKDLTVEGSTTTAEEVATDSDVAQKSPSADLQTVSSLESKSTLNARPQAITTEKVDHMAEVNGEDTSARLEALAKERASLSNEVAGLRKSLEEIQGKHQSELSNVQNDLEEARNDKLKAESDYNTLRERVGTIRSQLGDRLREDAEELSQRQNRIDELEGQNATLRSGRDAQQGEVRKLSKQLEDQSNEISTLRSRSNLSSQNWNREKEELQERESNLKAEFENAKQAMQDWEILAMEERSIRENLGERVADLEEQVTTHREAREKLEVECESQSSTVDGLQRALQELQEARKIELREVVENSQAQLENLRKQLESAETTSLEATNAKDTMAKELERLLPLESEIKEKNLLIGKLRHQAVGLNDHLTKALRQLKRGRPEDSVDRELVTNHFVHFLTLDRSDPRKFQILQIIASLLNWTDEQREQAGLARPGASNPNLRAPISPWNRTPSTPSLNVDMSLPDRNRQDSVGSAFAEFLERETANSTPLSSQGSLQPNTADSAHDVAQHSE